jgi:hypothetical protein
MKTGCITRYTATPVRILPSTVSKASVTACQGLSPLVTACHRLSRLVKAAVMVAYTVGFELSGTSSLKQPSAFYAINSQQQALLQNLDQ